MALARKKATTIALDPVMNKALTRAAKDRGVSRSEFVRQQLALVLEQYVDHPKPRCAGIAKGPLYDFDPDEEVFKDLEP
jgi:metal-responsive CopG/Arc/MetJ family transcriptional regulator